MKIRSAVCNNRKRVFEVQVASKALTYPYAKADPRPTASDRVAEVFVDPELGSEAFTYVLASGREGTVHAEEVLEYNREPSYLRDALLYQLTVEVQKRVAKSPLAKREIIRRLGTSATQFYRLLDLKNYRKSVDQMLHLLQVLDCDVTFVVSEKKPRSAAQPASRRGAP